MRQRRRIEVLVDRLGARRVTPFDLAAAMVQRAQRRLRGRSADRVRPRTGDATAIADPAASFDAVVDFGIIHHVPHWQQAVAEISRLLRPGGLLLVESRLGGMVFTGTAVRVAG